MALRDPASRLETAFNFEAERGWKFPWYSLLSRTRHTRSPRLWLQKFRNASDADHAALRHIFEASRSHNHTASVFRGWKAPGPGCAARFSACQHFVGSPALMPQYQYYASLLEVRSHCDGVANHSATFQGLHFDWQCALNDVEWHPLCLDRMASDWEDLLGRFNETPTERNRMPHANSSPKRFKLTEEEKAFVRGCMYREDWKLYQAFCGGRGGAKVSKQVSRQVSWSISGQRS